jgi:hypothetical protein
MTMKRLAQALRSRATYHHPVRTCHGRIQCRCGGRSPRTRPRHHRFERGGRFDHAGPSANANMPTVMLAERVVR